MSRKPRVVWIHGFCDLRHTPGPSPPRRLAVIDAMCAGHPAATLRRDHNAMDTPDDWVVAVAAATALLFIGVALVHTLAAFGSPVGTHLWGADREELPGLLRGASVVTVLGLTLAALVVWGRAGRSTVASWDEGLVAGLTWLLAVSLAAAALAAHSSHSRFERLALAPAAAVAALLVALVAAAGG